MKYGPPESSRSNSCRDEHPAFGFPRGCCGVWAEVCQSQECLGLNAAAATLVFSVRMNYWGLSRFGAFAQGAPDHDRGANPLPTGSCVAMRVDSGRAERSSMRGAAIRNHDIEGDVQGFRGHMLDDLEVEADS